MKKYLLHILLALMFLSSCTQDEFEPDPVGEQIPVEEIDKELIEELSGSGSSLFQKALEKSNVFKELDNRSQITFFVPTDNALKEAGINQQTIDQMTSEQCDTLVQYHTVEGQLDPAKIEQTVGNICMPTKCVDKKLRVSNVNGTEAYRYAHYVSVNNNQILIDGKVSGTFNRQQTKDADVIYIDRLLKRPTKDMLTFLKEDGRFSIFLEIIKRNDEMYYPATVYPYDQMYDQTGQYIYNNLNYDYQNKLMRSKLSDKTKIVKEEIAARNPNIEMLSLFAPTDDAFKKAGFNKAEDLRILNDHMYYSKYYIDHTEEWGWEYIEFQFPTNYARDGAPYDYGAFLKSDSIISYHAWGEKYLPINKGSVKHTLFFSNDLIQDYMKNYIISMAGYDPIKIPAIYNPFIFTQGNDGEIQVKLKNAKEGTEGATIIEPDIMTLNGPIHVVDRLFIPKDF